MSMGLWSNPAGAERQPELTKCLSTWLVFYNKSALEEPCPLRAWPQVPSSYIMCTDDRTITPVGQRKAARELLGAEPVELPGGHCPHVSCREALADSLVRIDNL